MKFLRIAFSKHAREESKKVQEVSKGKRKKEREKCENSYTTKSYTKYLLGPQKLWAILYLALRIHDDDIQLADMLR